MKVECNNLFKLVIDYYCCLFSFHFVIYNNQSDCSNMTVIDFVLFVQLFYFLFPIFTLNACT